MFKYVLKNKQRTTAALVGAYIFVVVLAVLMTGYVTAHHNLVDALHLASAQTPESFTELYFDNPGQLPMYAAPGKKQTVEFHIQNHSLVPLSTHYVITTSGLEGTLETEGNVTLRAGQGVTLPYYFVIPKANEQVTITINLVGTGDKLVLRSHS